MKRFWNWIPPETTNPDTQEDVRVLRINGAIAEESWLDDDVTPAIFASELNAGSDRSLFGSTVPVAMSWRQPGFFGDSPVDTQNPNILLGVRVGCFWWYPVPKTLHILLLNSWFSLGSSSPDSPLSACWESA
ncbi:Uncharacterised protein [Mobiluncus curtisii]|uniref:Uncharacterized protein n=1 Tax=Mobiluncus curtisii TaxID=2051 RepID=A0A2X3BEG8_9ACTO|nr:Uncharacterised protein [Mobiluncus curtisii]